MTAPPPPTAAQQAAASHCTTAWGLVLADVSDNFLSSDNLAVVRAYRAMTHALLASVIAGLPDSLVPTQPSTPIGVGSS